MFLNQVVINYCVYMTILCIFGNNLISREKNFAIHDKHWKRFVVELILKYSIKCVNFLFFHVHAQFSRFIEKCRNGELIIPIFSMRVKIWNIIKLHITSNCRWTRRSFLQMSKLFHCVYELELEFHHHYAPTIAICETRSKVENRNSKWTPNYPQNLTILPK